MAIERIFMLYLIHEKKAGKVGFGDGDNGVDFVFLRLGDLPDEFIF